ncbi:MAG: hypothetical protein ACKOHG_11505 [Planctomycetia bacterium]
MKTIRFLMAMAIVAAVSVGGTGTAGAADKTERKAAAPAAAWYDRQINRLSEKREDLVTARLKALLE